MTEGDWNLVLKMIESRLEREGASRCDGRGVEAVVGARWLASVLVENEHLRHQVTEVQARNTALEERARAAEKSAREAGGGAPSTSFAVIADLGQQRDEARRERDEARASLAAETVNANAYAHERDEALKQRDEECYYLNVCRSRRDELARELASVTASRDALASSSVPVELARLYRAAQGARGCFGAIRQQVKLVEECGEYVAEYMRTGERFSSSRVMAEAHDVLTVALSLCEPALMAKAAERLEGRLA